MPRYLLTGLFVIVGAILVVIGGKTKHKAEKFFAVLSFILAVCSWFVETDVPTPEIYLTNGDNGYDNKVYFQVEFPFSVYYTLTPYDDPKKTGQKYEDPFAVESSVTIRYVAGFAGIVWSETKSEDIILKQNGEVEVISTDEPGRSISEITAYLKNNNIFLGDVLSREDFEVKGTTVAGDSVTIDEFSFSPSEVVEGKNVVTVDYRGLTSEVNFLAHIPKIVSITATYLGEDIMVGDEISKDDIRVTATYDDGQVKNIDDFRIQPTVCSKEGANEIKVLHKQWSDSISVNAVEETAKETETVEESTENRVLFHNIYLDYNKSVINQLQLLNWEEDMKDVQGNTYTGKNLYLTISDLFNGIQDAGDSFIDASVVYIVNPQFGLATDAHVSGKFVVNEEYLGSIATTDIVIKLDGEEVWSTSESISGTTIVPTPFEFDVKDGTVTMTMEFHCNARGNGLGIGIIFNPVLQ